MFITAPSALIGAEGSLPKENEASRYGWRLLATPDANAKHSTNNTWPRPTSTMTIISAALSWLWLVVVPRLLGSGITLHLA